MLRILHNDKQGSVLRADAQQVDDVNVAPDDLHHVHLGDQVDHLGVGVALLEHLDRHNGAFAGSTKTERVSLHHLAEGALAQGAAQCQLRAREFPVRVKRELILGHCRQRRVLRAQPMAVGRGRGGRLAFDADDGHDAAHPTVGAVRMTTEMGPLNDDLLGPGCDGLRALDGLELFHFLPAHAPIGENYNDQEDRGQTGQTNNYDNEAGLINGRCTVADIWNSGFIEGIHDRQVGRLEEAVVRVGADDARIGTRVRPTDVLQLENLGVIGQDLQLQVRLVDPHPVDERPYFQRCPTVEHHRLTHHRRHIRRRIHNGLVVGEHGERRHRRLPADAVLAVADVDAAVRLFDGLHDELLAVVGRHHDEIVLVVGVDVGGVLSLEPEHSGGEGAGVEDAAEEGVHAFYDGEVVRSFQQLGAVHVVLQSLHAANMRKKNVMP